MIVSAQTAVIAAELTVILALFVCARRFLGARCALLVASNLALCAYLIWRTTGTLDRTWPSMAVGIALLVAEVIGAVQHAILSVVMARPERRTPSPWPEDQPLPTVDVFIPTYDEPLSILRRTLAACTSITYPADRLSIYVLDDGRRTEVKRLADQLGIHYLARPTNEHAKAGNLNHALQHSSGSLILILDADMVPKSWILERMVGHFTDPSMGFVQAPQAFFNPDPFQHNLTLHQAIPNEQDYFMRDMLAARDRFNAVMFVGSNALFSRSALDAVGGFSRGSITEDVPTGALVQSRGYRSAFLNEIVATGLAAESFREMLQQRIRWARGYVQAWRIHRPMRLPGLSIWQRLTYLSGLLYWYFGLQKLVYTLAPLLFLSFGMYALHATLSQLLVFWLPAFASSALSFRVIARRRRTSLWSHIYETAIMAPLAWAMVAETFHLRLLTFRVTKKGLVTRGYSIVHQAFWPLAGLIFFSLISIGRGLDELVAVHGLAILSFVAVNLVWACYNLFALVVGLLISIDRPRPRQTERFRVTYPVTVRTAHQTWQAETVDLSETGARLSFAHDPSLDLDPVEIEFDEQPDLSLSAIPVMTREDTGGWTAAFRFVDVTAEQYSGLVRLIFDRREEIDAARISSVSAVSRGVGRSLLAVRGLYTPAPASALVRRIYEELLTGGDLEVAEAIFAPNAQIRVHDALLDLPAGPDGAVHLVTALREAFPDAEVILQSCTQEGETVVARWVLRGTHQGPWLEASATGARVQATGIGVFRIADRRIVEWRSGLGLAPLVPQPDPISALGQDVASDTPMHVVRTA